MLFGGAKMDGDRHIWWNFVASSKELIEAAKKELADDCESYISERVKHAIQYLDKEESE